MLLYTERAHFFRRHKLSGARHLAVYSLPINVEFCVQLLHSLEAPKNGSDDSVVTSRGGSTCVVLFNRMDLLPLQRLVGDKRAARMLTSKESSFLFC